LEKPKSPVFWRKNEKKRPLRVLFGLVNVGYEVTFLIEFGALFTFHIAGI